MSHTPVSLFLRDNEVESIVILFQRLVIDIHCANTKRMTPKIQFQCISITVKVFFFFSISKNLTPFFSHYISQQNNSDFKQEVNLDYLIFPS